MPSDRQLLFALLRFGAADPENKIHILDAYLEECRGPLGQAHVDSAELEIFESLWRWPPKFASSPKEEEACREIRELARRVLDGDLAMICDRSAFSSKACLDLQAKCGDVLKSLGKEDEAPVSFFVLMCHTTD